MKNSKTYFSYNKLWKLLIDKGMKKKELREISGISTASLAKLSKSENITTEILLRICTALDCDIGEIVEYVREPEDTSRGGNT